MGCSCSVLLLPSSRLSLSLLSSRHNPGHPNPLLCQPWPQIPWHKTPGLRPRCLNEGDRDTHTPALQLWHFEEVIIIHFKVSCFVHKLIIMSKNRKLHIFYHFDLKLILVRKKKDHYSYNCSLLHWNVLIDWSSRFLRPEGLKECYIQSFVVCYCVKKKFLYTMKQ